VNAHPQHDRHSGRRALRGAFVALSLALFAGMLFWTKLRVIEHIPRSAYAVPPEKGGAAEASPTPPDTDHGDDTAPPEDPAGSQ